MKTIVSPKSRVLAGLALASLLVGAADTSAQDLGSIAGGGVSLDYLYITPKNDTDCVVICNPWLISLTTMTTDGACLKTDSASGTACYYEVGVETPFGSHGGFIDASDRHDPYGEVDSSSSGFAPSTYNVSGSSAATLSNTFVVHGGEGTICVNFESDLSISALVASAATGYTAGSSGYFRMFLDDQELFQRCFSISAEDGSFDFVNDTPILCRNLQLQYGQQYALSIEIGASSYATGDGSELPPSEEPVPEASTMFATALGFGLIGVQRLRKRARA